MSASPFSKYERGSALILVLLVLLVLSAIGMVALHDVSVSVRQSGMYRVRAQSQEGSGALLRFMTRRSGDRAEDYWTMMQSRQGFDLNAAGADMTTRTQIVGVGGWTLVDNNNIPEQLPGSSVAGETGLFNPGTGGAPSFERAATGSRFRVIMRDPMDGGRAPGYSQGKCFKKVTIVSEFGLGDANPDWNQAGFSAVSRHASEGFIGPVSCGAS